MSPQLLQSIRLMSMPASELRERIFEELERNPALEMTSDPAVRREDPGYGDIAAEKISSPEYSASRSDSDAHQAFLEGAVSRGESLQDHLLSQLRLLRLPERVRSFAESVIQNLGPSGFHLEPPETLPGGGDARVREQALDAVRRLDPVGTACRDFAESLLFQARYYEDAPPLAEKILDGHMDLLEKPRIDVIAKKLGATGEEVKEAISFIRSLEPFPGRYFDAQPPSYIIPDVIVKRSSPGGDDGSEFTVVINDEEIPVLGISSVFRSVAADRLQKPETRDFARRSVAEARWFMRSLSQRNVTLLKVVSALVRFQRGFFEKGVGHVVPLRLKDVAEAVGLHEATVSRISNGKYMQCEWGIFELKYLFSGAVPSTSPVRRSRESAKQLLREIIEQEGNALSDRELADRLKERGVDIARRTVAKYRSELTIKSSFDR